MSKEMLNLAAKVALANRESRQKYFLGCVAMREDQVLVRSHNLTVRENRTPSSHAEARVLQKAGKGAILWVAQAKRDGSWGQSFPCAKCRSLIRNHKVKRVYYTIGPDHYAIWDP